MNTVYLYYQRDLIGCTSGNYNYAEILSQPIKKSKFGGYSDSEISRKHNEERRFSEFNTPKGHIKDRGSKGKIEENCLTIVYDIKRNQTENKDW